MTKLSVFERKYLVERCRAEMRIRHGMIDAIKETGNWSDQPPSIDKIGWLKIRRNNDAISRHEHRIVGLRKVREAVARRCPIRDILTHIKEHSL